jgi:CBS domain-containing protein
VNEQDDVLDTLQRMRRRGVRRVPVLAANGTLAGIVTLDDLLELVAEQLGDIVKAITAEQSREAKTRK